MPAVPVTPATAGSSDPSLIVADSSTTAGDEFAAVQSLTWSKTDINVTHTLLSNPSTVLQSATSGVSTDKSDWKGQSECVTFGPGMVCTFECRFQWDLALWPNFLFGLVDASASRALVHNGVWVESASNSRVLKCRGASAAASTADYVAPASDVAAVIDGQWHTLFIEIRTSILGTGCIAQFSLDGTDVGVVRLPSTPIGPLYLFRGFVAGDNNVHNLYMDWIRRSTAR